MPNTKLKKPTIAQKVLVVEDEGELGLVLNMVLSERDVELDYVSTLLGADEYMQDNKPSVIILDNKLPDGYGVDFITFIRKNYPDSKIIMISGFASVRDVAMANGADVFFEKPFSLEEFNNAIDKLL